MILLLASVIGKCICGTVVFCILSMYPLYVAKKKETREKVNNFLRTIHDDDITKGYDRMTVINDNTIKENLRMNKHKNNEDQTSSSHNESSIHENDPHQEVKEKI